MSYVWDWSVAGSWLSGLGALLAVCVALWQSHKQNEKEKPRARISHETGEYSLTLSALSEGIVPVTVISAEIWYDQPTRKYSLSNFPKLGMTFPHKLERGEVVQLIDVKEVDFLRLANALMDPVIADLGARGLRADDGKFGMDETFFSGISASGKHGANLRLRTAHKDHTYILPSDFVDDVIKISSDQRRRQQQKKNDADKLEWKKMCEEIIALNVNDNAQSLDDASPG